MRAMIATVLAGSLLVSSAFAATDGAPVAPNNGPLAPGKPAGVQQADIEAGGVLLVVGILGLAAGIAFLAAGTQGKSSSTGTTQ